MSTRLPEISEAHAAGEIAQCYADIRDVTGLPRVNLIYRHFATIPNGLEWVWSRLRPQFQNGSIAIRAAQLRQVFVDCASAIIARGSIPPFMVERPETRDVLDFYLAANPMNLLALKLLEFKSTSAVDIDGQSKTDAPRAPPSADLDDNQQRVRDIALLFTAGDRRIVPTVIRDLGKWPDYLQYFESLATAVCTTPPFAERCDEISATADTLANEIRGSGAVPNPSTAIDNTALLEIQSFCNHFPRIMVKTTLVLAAARLLCRRPQEQHITGSN